MGVLLVDEADSLAQSCQQRSAARDPGRSNIFAAKLTLTAHGRRGSPASWLFPGQVPGRHLSVNGLVRQLNAHGIRARPARSAALINLAADLSAAAR
jgi:hypothetical protein